MKYLTSGNTDFTWHYLLTLINSSNNIILENVKCLNHSLLTFLAAIKRWSLIKTWNIAIDAKINYYQFSYMSTIFLCLCKIKHRSTFLNTVPKWTICQSYDSRKEEIFSFANRHFYTRKEKRERQEAKKHDFKQGKQREF